MSIRTLVPYRSETTATVTTFSAEVATATAASPTAVVVGSNIMAAAVCTAAAASPTSVMTGTGVLPNIATYRIEVDWNNDGTFTGTYDDITADVLFLECSRGRDYASELTGKAGPGKLTATLRNDAGKYSPFNVSSPLYGSLLPGRKMRVRTTHPFADVLSSVYIDTIEPEGSGSDWAKARLTAVGALAKLAESDVSPSASDGNLTGVLIATVLNDADWPSTDQDLDFGKTTTGRWAIQDKDALTAIRELEETELGFVFESGDGKVMFQDRHYRLLFSQTSQATFSDAAAASLPYSSIAEMDPLREIFNLVRATVTSYAEGAATVLWTLTGESPVLPPKTTRTWWATYQGSGYVKEWETPILDQDVTVSGVDISYISGFVTKFARSMKLEQTNNHPILPATITLLQAIGTPAEVVSPTDVVSEDATSQADYGRRPYKLPGLYYATTNDAEDHTNYVLSRYKDPLAHLAITIPANGSSALLEQALVRDISDRVTLTATALKTNLGLDEDFFIEAIHHRIGESDSGQGALIQTTTFLLSPVAGDGGYWVLGLSVLGTDTRVGY